MGDTTREDAPADRVVEPVEPAEHPDAAAIRAMLRRSPEERLAGLKRAARFFAAARRV